ncbi:DsbA family oxidoreductase [Marinicrinis lubricantis]|uniref:DsbA family oxidoreductase n=1 Tax=Marinicrinis lubricantis TaxID=2086470 RepID=A0ABW1IQ15_9BACL
MKVEIWSDFVCPFCYIGKRRFEAGLNQFAHKEQVEVMYRSFELDPNMKRDGNPSAYDMLAVKYGMSREQAIANCNQVTQQAKEVGLDYDLGKAIQTNTFDAHRLAHYAASQGKLAEMTERLLKAHFTDMLHVGNHDTLADLAAEVGLNRDEVLRVLAAGEYADGVRSDEQEAADLGIRGVPFFVINRKYAVSGAQPSEVFLEALQKAWEEDQPLTVLGGDSDAALCTDDGCIVPAKGEHRS